MIQATCPACRARYPLADDMAGRRVRCRACSTVFGVYTEEDEVHVLSKRAPRWPTFVLLGAAACILWFAEVIRLPGSAPAPSPSPSVKPSATPAASPAAAPVVSPPPPQTVEKPARPRPPLPSWTPPPPPTPTAEAGGGFGGRPEPPVQAVKNALRDAVEARGLHDIADAADRAQAGAEAVRGGPPARTPPPPPPPPTRSAYVPEPRPDASSGGTMSRLASGLADALRSRLTGGAAPVAAPVGPPGGGMFALTLKLPVADLEPCLTWDDDARSFFTLDGAGVVRRFSVDGFREQARLESAQGGGWLARSAAGVVLSAPRRKEVWVLDPKTLAVQRKLAVPEFERAICSPAAAVCFGVGGPSIWSADLRSGTVGKALKLADLDARLNGKVTHGAVSRDGRHLIVLSSGRIARLRIEGAGVVHEQTSGVLDPAPVTLQMSPDGTLVAAPAAGGRAAVYATARLEAPQISLAAPSLGDAFGLDARGGLYFANDGKRTLIALDRTGKTAREIKLVGARARQVLVHPDGRKLLALSDARLSWIELPAE
jgi:predicted Zn finger-like uncharacterized protein